MQNHLQQPHKRYSFSLLFVFNSLTNQPPPKSNPAFTFHRLQPESTEFLSLLMNSVIA